MTGIAPDGTNAFRTPMVHFVGAGPGAPDLITLRGKQLLERSEVVVYAGSLVNPQLLQFVQQGCEVHNSAEMTLDEVIAVMERAVWDKKEVVRLHTGDPSLFGAIREQMDRLSVLGIPFDICPGVSSFCAAAAALQAEYTLPGVSQTVILTRVKGKTTVPDREALRSLAEHRATMVLFLSAGQLETISRELMAGGYPSDTPAAIVYKASWSEEKIVRCTVNTLAASAEAEGITKTALICVGWFLGDDYELSRLYAADFSTEYREASV